MSSYLVTGGAGFIGSHLIRELTKTKDVVVVDNFSSGTRENLEGVFGLTVIEMDLSDDGAVDNLYTALIEHDVDVIFHLAAAAGVPFSVEHPTLSRKNNDTITSNVLEAARLAECKRVVFSSSSSIYGGVKDFPTVEEDDYRLDYEPKSPYAFAKMHGESLCRMYSSIYGLDTVCLRYFNIFGPRQQWEGGYAAVVAAFLKARIKNSSCNIYGTGLQFRDMTYVSNAVQANILAANHKELLMGEAFNVGTGSSVTVLDIHEAVGEPKANFLPERPGDVFGSKASIKKIRDWLGYNPSITFEEGIIRTINWASSLKG